MKSKIGFLGGGRMATAIFKGIQKHESNFEFSLYDPNIQSENEVWKADHILSSAEELFLSCDWLIWSIKPQVFKENFQIWEKFSFNGQGMISIMAGIPLQQMETLFPTSAIIRTMPNTPLMLGEGMTAYSVGKKVNEEHIKFLENIFQCLGNVLKVDEGQMDGVTAISGSGPAYLFYLTEAIQNKAENLGLTKIQCRDLWAQTLVGAAKMLMNSSKSSSELREQVTSPGGTTQAALEVFEKEALAESFTNGILAAKERSIALSR